MADSLFADESDLETPTNNSLFADDIDVATTATDSLFADDIDVASVVDTPISSSVQKPAVQQTSEKLILSDPNQETEQNSQFLSTTTDFSKGETPAETQLQVQSFYNRELSSLGGNNINAEHINAIQNRTDTNPDNVTTSNEDVSFMNSWNRGLLNLQRAGYGATETLPDSDSIAGRVAGLISPATGHILAQVDDMNAADAIQDIDAQLATIPEATWANADSDLGGTLNFMGHLLLENGPDAVASFVIALASKNPTAALTMYNYAQSSGDAAANQISQFGEVTQPEAVQLVGVLNAAVGGVLDARSLGRVIDTTTSTQGLQNVGTDILKTGGEQFAGSGIEGFTQSVLNESLNEDGEFGVREGESYSEFITRVGKASLKQGVEAGATGTLVGGTMQTASNIPTLVADYAPKIGGVATDIAATFTPEPIRNAVSDVRDAAVQPFQNMALESEARIKAGEILKPMIDGTETPAELGGRLFNQPDMTQEQVTARVVEQQRFQLIPTLDDSARREVGDTTIQTQYIGGEPTFVDRATGETIPSNSPRLVDNEPTTSTVEGSTAIVVDTPLALVDTGFNVNQQTLDSATQTTAQFISDVDNTAQSIQESSGNTVHIAPGQTDGGVTLNRDSNGNAIVSFNPTDSIAETKKQVELNAYVAIALGQDANKPSQLNNVWRNMSNDTRDYFNNSKAVFEYYADRNTTPDKVAVHRVESDLNLSWDNSNKGSGWVSKVIPETVARARVNMGKAARQAKRNGIPAMHNFFSRTHHVVRDANRQLGELMYKEAGTLQGGGVVQKQASNRNTLMRKSNPLFSTKKNINQTKGEFESFATGDSHTADNRISSLANPQRSVRRSLVKGGVKNLSSLLGSITNAAPTIVLNGSDPSAVANVMAENNVVLEQSAKLDEFLNDSSIDATAEINAAVGRLASGKTFTLTRDTKTSAILADLLVQQALTNSSDLRGQLRGHLNTDVVGSQALVNDRAATLTAWLDVMANDGIANAGYQRGVLGLDATTRDNVDAATDKMLGVFEEPSSTAMKQAYAAASSLTSLMVFSGSALSQVVDAANLAVAYGPTQASFAMARGLVDTFRDTQRSRNPLGGERDKALGSILGITSNEAAKLNMLDATREGAQTTQWARRFDQAMFTSVGMVWMDKLARNTSVRAADFSIRDSAENIRMGMGSDADYMNLTQANLTIDQVPTLAEIKTINEGGGDTSTLDAYASAVSERASQTVANANRGQSSFGSRNMVGNLIMRGTGSMLAATEALGRNLSTQWFDNATRKVHADRRKQPNRTEASVLAPITANEMARAVGMPLNHLALVPSMLMSVGLLWAQEAVIKNMFRTDDQADDYEFELLNAVNRQMNPVGAYTEWANRFINPAMQRAFDVDDAKWYEKEVFNQGVGSTSGAVTNFGRMLNDLGDLDVDSATYRIPAVRNLRNATGTQPE